MKIEVEGGDYKLGEGLGGLIWRALVTPKGGFAHLPDWGAGLELKKLATRSRLRELKQRIEEAVSLMPQVAGVSVRTELKQGIVYISMRVKLKEGSHKYISWEVSNG